MCHYQWQHLAGRGLSVSLGKAGVDRQRFFL
jgi:hypothetical protein